MHAIPPATGIQAPAPEPLCAATFPEIPGTSCGAPAAWHVRWDQGVVSAGTLRFLASLLCAPHADEQAGLHTWHSRHPAGPACSSPDPTWQPNGCTTTAARSPDRAATTATEQL